MKIKKQINLEVLGEFGFFEEFPYVTDCSDNYEFDNKWIYELGHSRRGQFYYCLIDKATRVISIYATKPDGDGTDLELDDILFRLDRAGMVDFNEI